MFVRHWHIVSRGLSNQVSRVLDLGRIPEVSQECRCSATRQAVFVCVRALKGLGVSNIHEAPGY